MVQELFQLFGELGIRTKEAFQEIDKIEKRVQELAEKFKRDLQAEVSVNDQATQGLDQIASHAEQTQARLRELENTALQLEQQMNQDIEMGIDVNDSEIVRARNELQFLRREIARLRREAQQEIDINANVPDPSLPPSNATAPGQTNTDQNFTQPNYQTPYQPPKNTMSRHQIVISTNVDEANAQIDRVEKNVDELQNKLNEAYRDDESTVMFNGAQTNVKQLLGSLNDVEKEMANIKRQMDSINSTDLDFDVKTGQAGNGSRQQEFNGLASQLASLERTMSVMTATMAASTMGGPGAGLGMQNRMMQNFGYDINRVFQAQLRANQMMLRYAQMMDPKNAVGRAREKIEIGASVIPHLDRAKTQLEIQALQGMMTSGIMTARRQLSQLGFGRTNMEVKALEAQMYNLGNVQLDNLKDNIKLTEKALKDMKASANADDLVDEIAKAEEALQRYNTQLKNANPMKQIARVNGYNVENIFGKDVFVKPLKGQINKMSGMLNEFFNKDVAMLMNKAYTTIDGAAKKIVGAQTTALEQKQKIMALQTRYTMLGQQLNTFVTPAVLALAAGFAMVGAAAEKGFTKFQAQTLTANKDMETFKRKITDASVATGASQAEVGELFSILHNQMGRTKDNIQESAEMGLFFKKVWGVDAATAVASVDTIMQDLGVSTEQAQDILALALKKHQGNIAKATADVDKHGKAWVEATKETKKGAKAYDDMVKGIDNGGIAQSGKALRQMGAALLELWKQLEPTVIKIANGIEKAARATTEWLRANPGMASFLAHAVAIGGALLVVIGALAPIAGFLIMNRALFQGLAQAMGAASKGAVVFSPAVKMLMDNLKLTKNAVLGLPRVIAGIGPALAAMLRGLPGGLASMAVNFIKMNPLLAAFGAFAWVAYKNWDRFQPIFANMWDSIKRIAKAVLDAFAGPGGTATDQFGRIMDKVAKVAGDVLLPILKVLAKVLEAVAIVAENGGGGFIAAGIAMWFFGGALGPVIGLLGGTKKGILGLLNPFSKLGGLAKFIGPALMGGLGKIGPIIKKIPGIIGPVLSRIPAMFALVGRGLAALGPLLMNPWTWVVLAIAGIAILIYKNWDKIKAGTIKIWKSITNWLKEHWKSLSSSVSGVFGAVGKAISKVWDGIKSGTKKVWRGITNWLREHWKTIAAIVAGPFGLIVLAIAKNWDKIKSGTRRVWRSITNWLKDHWKSIVTFVAGPFGAIALAISQNWSKIRRNTRNVWNSIKSFLGGLWRGLRTTASNVLDSITGAFSRGWSAVRRVTRNVWNGIKSFLGGLWRGLRRTASSVVSSIGKVFTDGWNAIRRTTRNVWNSIKTFLRNTWNSIRSTFRNVMNSIRETSNRVWTSLTNKAKSLVKSMKNAIIGAYNSMKNSISGAMSSIRRSVVDNFNRAKTSGTNAAAALGRAVARSFRSMLNGATSFGRKFYSAVANSFKKMKDLGSNMVQYGKDVVSGFINGIMSMIGGVGKAVRAISSETKSNIKSALGIASPSKVTTGYGINVGEGYINGVGKMIGGVRKVVRKVADVIQPPDKKEMTMELNAKVKRNVTTNVGQTIARNAYVPDATQTASKVNSSNVSNVSNNQNLTSSNRTSHDNSMNINNAKFNFNVKGMKDANQLRKSIQSVVSNDLFGMAVRNQ